MSCESSSTVADNAAIGVRGIHDDGQQFQEKQVDGARQRCGRRYVDQAAATLTWLI